MKLADVSIRRPVLATVMVGALLVFGVFAYPRVGVDLYPDVEFPVATITAIYPGADPETIETKIVDPLEEAISTVNGIKVLASTSLENIGQIVVQFELDRKAAEAVQDVRDKVARAVRDLPTDLETPTVERMDIGAAPIMAVAVSGPRSTRELTRIADLQVKQRLQTILGVGGIDLVGAQEREFHVWIDPTRLDALGLSVQDVMHALAAGNVEIPGGRLNIGNQEVVVKTRGQVHSAQELGDIVITATGGALVRVRDIARVEDGAEEARSASELNGQPAISLVIRKQSGANTVQVADDVRQAVDALSAQLPSDITLDIPMDNSTYIKTAIHEVQFDLAFGALLAVIIILFFLHDWRATAISALAIPTAVIATVAFIQAMGFTFNNLTMLGLTLSIGILVDDAIVVIEAIHRHVAQGKPKMQAASDACKEIGLAIMATTASLVAVFIPVAVMEGIIGRFFLQFGLTVAFATSVSLFVAMTLVPMLSSRFLTLKRQPGGLSARIERLVSFLDRIYGKLLARALRRRGRTLTIAIVALTVSLGIARWIPTEFMPPEDRGEFAVRIEMPTGTDLATTAQHTADVAAWLRTQPGVSATFSTVGGGVREEVNKADIQVNLVPRQQRAFSQTEAMIHLRALLAQRQQAGSGAQYIVDRVDHFSEGAFRTALIQFNIRGADFAEINRAADAVIALMQERGGYVDVDTTYRGGKPEFRVVIDRERAADLQVPVATVATSLQALVAGQKVTEITTDNDRFDVRLRLDEVFRRDAGILETIRVRATSGELIPLSNLVSVSRDTGPSVINRQARQRQITVLANLEGKTLGQAVTELEAAAPSLVPAHLTWDWAGMGEVMKESFGHLFAALILAVIMIYLILAAQFESFIHPLTIMFSLPLSLIGAFGALLGAGMTINIFSLIGVIMLMGLVTKNAILLVDYTNQLRDRGMTVTEALLQAGRVRLRPILMTTSAMIAGMTPVALGQSEGGELRAPMAVCVIGGLITSTLLTLVVVPVVYSLMESLKARMAR